MGKKALEVEEKAPALPCLEISRTNLCGHFVPRHSFVPIEQVCWFCRYAQFDLSAEQLPENGQCKYPNVQIV